MKDRYLKITKTIICILIITVVALTFISKSFENDIFFDLKTGESILKYGIDFKDHFSFIPDLTYIYHHWLYDLIILKIYSIGKFDALFLFFTALFAIFGIAVYYVNTKRNNNIISLIIAILTMYISSHAFMTRVQSVTYTLLFLEIYFLEKLYKEGKVKYSIYLILMAVLTVNIHMPIWIVYIIFTVPYLIETLLHLLSKKIKLKNLKIEKPKNSKLIINTILSLLLTGLISPLKLYPYTFITGVLNNNSYQIINEMKRTVLYYQKWELLIIIIILVSSYLKILKFNIRDYLLTLGLFLLSLMSLRNTAFFLTIIPTLYIKNINIKKIEFKKITNRIDFKVINTFTLIILAGLNIFLINELLNLKNNYNIEIDYPDKSVKYIKENLDYKNIKLYNEFDFGSYLEYYDIPVFIDSRAEVYMEKFNKKSDIMSDYNKVDDYAEYEKVFKKYEFDYALVYKKTNIYKYLKNNDNYEIIFKETNREETPYILFKKKEL